VRRVRIAGALLAAAVALLYAPSRSASASACGPAIW
jgi:gas vesicle protein